MLTDCITTTESQSSLFNRGRKHVIVMVKVSLKEIFKKVEDSAINGLHS